MPEPSAKETQAEELRRETELHYRDGSRSIEWLVVPLVAAFAVAAIWKITRGEKPAHRAALALLVLLPILAGVTATLRTFLELVRVVAESGGTPDKKILADGFFGALGWIPYGVLWSVAPLVAAFAFRRATSK